MNPVKQAALGALILATTGSVHADTIIRFSASNGDRTATQTAIGKLLTNWTYRGFNGVNITTAQAGGTGFTVPTSVTGSNFGIWRGTWASPSGPQILIIKTNYAGALAGIAAVAGNVDQRFMRGDSVPGTPGDGDPDNDSQTISPIASNAVLGTHYENGKVDFGFSTNFQSTSPFEGEFGDVTYQDIEEEFVGVSPLGFYASPGFPADNITSQQVQYLYNTGSIPLAIFTGNWTDDRNKIVYAIGRNTDAGQRFGAYLEAGLSTSSTVTVWDPRTVRNAADHPTAPNAITGGISGATTLNGVTSGGTVLSHKRWPEETISGIYSPTGNGGFDGGATLAPVLTTHLGAEAYKGAYIDEFNNPQYQYPNATAGYYIGYLTPGDANPRVLDVRANPNFGQPGEPEYIDAGNIAEGDEGKALKYNGVENTSSNVRNGQYTVWLYNRFLYPSSWNETSPATIPMGFGYALRDRIRLFDAPAGGGLIYEQLPAGATFKVQRASDGGLVTPR